MSVPSKLPIISRGGTIPPRTGLQKKIGKQVPTISQECHNVKLGSWKQRQRGLKLSVNPSSEQDTSDDHSLFDYNEAFQEAILTSMDREMDRYEATLLDKDSLLADVRQTKEDLAIALKEEKDRTIALNKAVETLKNLLKEHESEIKIIMMERNGLKNSLEIARNGEDEARRQLRKQNEELRIAHENLLTTRSMTLAYDSDIKVRMNIEDRLKKDIHSLEEDKQTLESTINKMKEDMNAVKQQKVQGEEELNIAKSMLVVKDGKVLAIKRELDKAVESKEVLLRKWRSALGELEKRDTKIHDVASQNKELEATLILKHVEVKTLEKHGTSITKDLLEAKNVATKLKEDLKGAEIVLDLEKKTADRVKKQLNDVKKEQSEVLSKLNETGGLQEALENIQRESEDKAQRLAQAKHDIIQSEKKAKKAEHDMKDLEDQYVSFASNLEKTVERREKDAMKKNKVLENENQQLFAKNAKLELTLTHLASEYGALGIAHDRLTVEYKQLCEDAGKLERQIPLQQIRVDRAKEELLMHKNGEHGTNKTILILEQKIKRLKEELEKSQKRIRDITVAWVEGQEEAIKRDEALFVKSSTLLNEKARNKIISMQFERAANSEKTLEKKVAEALLSTDSLRAENANKDKKIKELEFANSKLELAITHFRHQLKAKNDETQDLKSGSSSRNREIGNQWQQLKKELLESEQRRSIDHRIAKVAKSQMKEMRIELKKVQAELLEFQLQAGRRGREEKNTSKGLLAIARSWESAFHRRRSKRQAKNLRKKALLAERRKERREELKHGKARNGEDSVEDTVAHWFGNDIDLSKELSSLGGSAKYKKLVLRLNESMNLAAERLRQIVETKKDMKIVIEERNKLAQDLYLMKQRTNQSTKEDGDQRIEQVKLMNRLVRAEALAASFEVQLRNAIRGEQVIEYTYKPDIEASPRLQAALAQSLIVSADEIATDLNEENLRLSVKTPNFCGTSRPGAMAMYPVNKSFVKSVPAKDDRNSSDFSKQSRRSRARPSHRGHSFKESYGDLTYSREMPDKEPTNLTTKVSVIRLGSEVSHKNLSSIRPS